MKIWWKGGLVVLCAANLLTLLFNIIGVVHTSATLDPAIIESEMGNAYRLSLQAYERQGILLHSRLNEWSFHVERELILYEDGKPLGPATRSISAIRESGRGAYSYGGTTLIFSTSDNTDPRTNGRVYVAAYPLFTTPLVQGGMLIFSALIVAGWMWRIGSGERHAVYLEIQKCITRAGNSRALMLLIDAVIWLTIMGTIVYVNVTILTATKSLPCLWPDSSGYVEWSVMRTPGYPFFIHAILTVLGDIRWIVPIQLNVLLVSIVLMGWTMSALFRSRLVIVLVVLPLCVTTPLLLTACNILTEALFASTICFHIASVFTLLRTKSRCAALWTGITMGLAVAVRPVGYSLLTGLLLLVLFLRDRWRTIMPILVSGLGVVILAAGTVQYARHGLWGTQAMGGLALAAHVLPIVSADLQNGYPELTKQLAERVVPLVGDLQDPSSFHRHWQATQAFGPEAWRQVILTLDEYVRRTEPGLSGEQRMIRMNSIAMTIAWSAIRNRPSWYIRHVASHYYGSWSGFLPGYGPIIYHVIKCRIQTVGILEAQAQAYGARFSVEHYRNLLHDAKDRSLGKWVDLAWDHHPYFTPPMIEGAVAITLVAILSLFVGGLHSDRTQALAYVAVLIHASFILLAFVWVGSARYVLPFVPVLVVVLVGGLIVAGEWVATRIAAHFQRLE